MATIKLYLDKESQDLGNKNYSRLFDISNDGIEMYPKHNDFPMPWDAACYIEDGMFIIDGDLGQQGSHKGYAKVGLPLDRVMNYLDLAIIVDDEYEEEAAMILASAGWMNE